MTQYGYEPLSPTDSGSTLLERINGVVPALVTNHKGPARPGYVQPGMMWIDDSGSKWLLNLFDGANDVAIAAIDPDTHTVVAAYVPAARKLKVGAGLVLDGVAGTDAEPAEADLTADLTFTMAFAPPAVTIAGERDDLPVHPAGLKAAIAALAPRGGYTDVDYVNTSGDFVAPADLDEGLDPLVFVWAAGGGYSSTAGGAAGLSIGTVSIAASEIVPVTVGASVLSGRAGSSVFKSLSATGGLAGGGVTPGAGTGSGGNLYNGFIGAPLTQSLARFAARAFWGAFFSLPVPVAQIFSGAGDAFMSIYSTTEYTSATPWTPSSGYVPGSYSNDATNRYGAGGAVIIFYRRKGG
ncbi:hypothetical protein [Pleomorphomonas sp. JP5]|uniref:hypothetical protein n=1 Tax=Pleomorphomonas sp. JP5 TaxID=2942998 RepID=UPI002043F308|nr:hypothetical protein [Pleomorphomonas sp. JP5]MCM5556273.1 hypothetical protein [Pleomorphomonas sp. JP5]